MDTQHNSLSAWMEAVLATPSGTWEQLPDLDLYMDQVVRLMEKYLDLVRDMGDEKLLTSGMINNYVKGGALPRPVQKKYGREHLALLQLICLLKPVLPLSEVTKLTQDICADDRVAELYTEIMRVHTEELQQVVERIERIGIEDKRTMYSCAIVLALEANARRLAALHILEQTFEDLPAEGRD